VSDISAILGMLTEDWHHPLHLLRENRDALMAFARQDEWRAIAAFLAVDIGLLCFFLPINVPMSLAAGLMFGWRVGLAVAALGTAAGATICCLTSRSLLRDWTRRRLSQRLAQVEQGLEREGAMYLLSLRLAPIVPYNLVNLLFGITNIPLSRFFLITLIGTLPATAAYVNAGVALQILDDVGDLANWRLLLALTPLALAPILLSRLRQAKSPPRK
jgi:uncharacterized membrane protein YdjX (TVP38/TMEM64 family)